jgi:TetR/AcrR family transcriptional repressor of nem operon
MKKQNDTIEWPETKRRLVDAGVNLMRARGFNATSVDEICFEAGVTKGGFFHYFKSKDELARTAVMEFREGRAKELQDASFRKLVDPLDRVFGRIDYVKSSLAGGRTPKGCLIGMLAQELSFTNPELRASCREGFARIAQDFEKDLADAKAAYAPKASFDPKKLALLYVSIFQGSLIMAKASESAAVVSENLDQFRDYLEHLFGQLKAKRGEAR